MTVAMMLDAKGHDVITVHESATIAEVATVLAENRIGALIVTGNSGPMSGIVSERDIVRAVATNGASALDQPVSTVMTKNVMTCQKRDTIDAVATMMNKGRFRHVPVLEEGQLAGIISVSDVVTHRMAQIDREAQEMKRYIMEGARG